MIFVTTRRLKIIGSGSSGTVIRAQSTKGLHLSYAIKVYHALTSETAVHEAGIMKNLHDQLHCKNNIVTAFGLVAGPISASPTIMDLLKSHLARGVISEDAVGLVMSYEEGGSLEGLLYPPDGTPKIPLNMTDKIKILIDIVSGLYEIHNLGMSHNDVKPGNILISRKVDISTAFFKLADFGLSSQNKLAGLSQTSKTEHGNNTLKGTTLYMALEILKGEVAPSRRSDMYGFGLLAWEVMAEKKPFKDVSTEIMLALGLQEGKKPNEEDLPEDLAIAIREMVYKLLEKDRNMRPRAIDCYEILKYTHDLLCEKKYDIFFSHLWMEKPFLRFIYKLLCSLGYRVWYDMRNMDQRTDLSMEKGIRDSELFLCCISSGYQESWACMFELRKARELGKPVITLIVEEGFFPRPKFNLAGWANDELKELTEYRRTLLVGDEENEFKDPVGLATLAKLDWSGNNEAATTAQLQDLSKKISPLMKVLRENNCFPTMPLPEKSKACAARIARKLIGFIYRTRYLKQQADAQIHAIVSIEDAVELLLSDNRSINKFTFAALLSKLSTMVDTNNSHIAAITPHLDRIVTIMQQQVHSSTLVRNGMTLIRFICKHSDGPAAMSPVTLEIMRILQKRRKCIKVAEAGLLAVNTVVSNAEDKTILGVHIVTIVAIVEEHHSNANVTEAGLAALGSFASSNAMNQVILGAHIDTLVGIVEEHLTNAEITEAGLRDCIYAENQVILGGHIGAIVSVVEEHRTNAEVAEAGLSVLCCIAHLNSENQMALGGHIGMIVAIVEEHRTNAKVAYAGLLALCNIAGSHAENHEILGSHAGTIVGVVQEHRTNAKVSLVCLGALCNIAASNVDNQVILGGHIGTIVGIVEEHRTNAEVAEAGLWALFYIADSNAENQVILGGHIGTIVGIVEEHRTNAEIAFVGLGALANIAHSNAENKVILGGHIGIIVDIVEKHRTNAKVSVFGVYVIHNIASVIRNKGNSPEQKSVRELVQSLMQQHPNNSNIASFGKRSLHRMSKCTIS